MTRLGNGVSAIVLVLLVYLLKFISTSKIFIIHPLQGGSHRIQLGILGEELLKRGHTITTLSFVNVGDKKHNTTHINSTRISLTVENSDKRYPYITQDGLFEFPNKLLWEKGDNPSSLPLNAFKTTEALCRTLFNNVELLEQLKNEKFDISIIDLISNECGLAYIHQLGITSVVAYWAMFPVGGEMDYLSPFISQLPSYIPSFLSKLSSQMTYWERTYNSCMKIGSFIVMQIQFYLAHKYIQEYFSGAPYPSELIANLSGVLVNSDYSFDYPRLLPSNVLFVGCLQCKSKPEPLPQELEDFMESSGEHGILYVSMGALFDLEFAKDLLPKLFNAFSRLNQKILLKSEMTATTISTNATGDKIFSVPSNVKIFNWVPQQDILGHRRTRAFFTHCGLHSVMEALWFSVPMIALPVFGDQHDVLVRIKEKGIGLGLSKDSTQDEMYDVIQAVLTNSSFQKQSKSMQALFRDQREHPMTRSVWFIEHLLRHNGADHLKSHSRFLPWYQLYCLDIVIGFLIMSLLILCILIKIIFCTFAFVKLMFTFCSQWLNCIVVSYYYNNKKNE